jgi:hypothetical protein
LRTMGYEDQARQAELVKRSWTSYLFFSTGILTVSLDIRMCVMQY